MYAWILSILMILTPQAAWSESYPELASAIVEAAEEHPLFQGEDGVEETALLLVAVAKYESEFNADARGDGGASLGAWQIGRSHAPAAELLDPRTGAKHALRLFEASFRICRKRPFEERLGWYAWGRDGCDHALDKSRHRMMLAQRLKREHPRPPPEEDEPGEDE